MGVVLEFEVLLEDGLWRNRRDRYDRSVRVTNLSESALSRQKVRIVDVRSRANQSASEVQAGISQKVRLKTCLTCRQKQMHKL